MASNDWIPHAKQKTALERSEFEILFGGARGGGKTDAGQAWLLYDKDNPLYKALVIRRNADDLSDWIARARVMYTRCGGIVSGNPPIIKFPSGAFIKTGHLKDENAYEKYQGHEYQKMLIEELTQIPREIHYLKLISSCRSTVEEIRPQVFATTNPGNAGHKWVRSRFVDVGPPETTFLDPITGRSRIFIPAKVDDNPSLMEKDPDYVHFLDGLPDGLREAWRDGSWDDIEVEGAYYVKQLTQVRSENRISTGLYDPALKVNTAWDLGIGDATSIWFFQQHGFEVRLIEYYETQGEGLPFYAKLLQDKPYIYGYHLAPHDIEVRELGSGLTRLEVARKLGIPFTVVPKLPIEEGIDTVRRMFNKCYFDKDKCEDGINALSQYRKEFDEKKNEFKNKPLHDWSSHAADAFRYLALGRKEKHTRSFDHIKDPEIEEMEAIRRYNDSSNDPIRSIDPFPPL